MEKSKLGISVCLLGALAFVAGYANFVVLALVAGYILLKEENTTLKKCAVYAVSLFVAFFGASLLISIVETVFNILNVNGWMYSVDVINTIYSVIRAILSTIRNILSLVEIVVFGLFTVCTLMGKEIKVSFLDKFVEKHF